MKFHAISRFLAGRAEEFCQTYLAAGKRVGQEWLVGDVLGQPGKSLAVQLEGPKAGLWNDRANAQEHGDLLDLLARQQGDKIKAADEARRFLGVPAWKPGESRNGNGDAPRFDPLKHAFTRKGDTEKRFPKAAWPYHDPDGHVVAYACRFEFGQDPDSGKMVKDVLPLRFIDGQWRWKGWSGDEKRPLYGLHRLKQRPEAPVLIVEGEKTADAAQKIFQRFVVITWQGGCKAVQKADLDPILSRRTEIVLWPDADRPGEDAIHYLKARMPKAHVVRLPKELPEGWDLADQPPTGVSIQGILDASLAPPAAVEETEAPFRLLGFDEDGYHYAPKCSGLIITLDAKEHTELTMQKLAGDDWWFSAFPPGKDLNPNYRAAAKALIQQQHAVGYFDPDRIRGLGCWMEGDKVVYHAGDRLYIDGVETSIYSHKTPFVYTRRARLPNIDFQDFASLADCAKFLNLCKALSWKHPNSYWFLPGIIVAAIVGGVLDWRPHGWLNGPAGSGKSFIYHNILLKILIVAIRAQSSTTESGIRQLLYRDAITVMFDEIEPRDERAISRISGVLELMRQSSSETGGSIIKGSQSGHAKQYRIRSSFLFCSIAMAATEVADESRITKMELRKATADEFDVIKQLIAESVADPAFCRRIFARSVRMAKTIYDSAAIFTDVISRVAGDARVGQQYGAIAAGYWSLVSDSVVDPRFAFDWASGMDWTDIKPDGNETDDAGRCIDVLLQAQINVLDHLGTRQDLSIGELLLTVDREPPGSAKYKVAYEHLMRHGVHPIAGSFDVATKHTALDKIFRGTNFSVGYHEHLLRSPGAKRAVYNPPGQKSARCVRIPNDIIDGLQTQHLGI